MLAQAGLVRPRRGLGGGFALVRSPSNMTILDVVSAVDPIGGSRNARSGAPHTASSFASYTAAWTRRSRWSNSSSRARGCQICWGPATRPRCAARYRCGCTRRPDEDRGPRDGPPSACPRDRMRPFATLVLAVCGHQVCQRLRSLCRGQHDLTGQHNGHRAFGMIQELFKRGAEPLRHVLHSCREVWSHLADTRHSE